MQEMQGETAHGSHPDTQAEETLALDYEFLLPIRMTMTAAIDGNKEVVV